MRLGSRGAFALVLLLGVAGTGISVRLFSAAGLETLGSIIWIVGYGTTIFVLWYGWLRPLDITGQTDPEEVREATDADGDHETVDS